MTQLQSGLDQSRSGAQVIDRRAWPRARQIRWAGLVSLMIVGVIVIATAGKRLFDKPPPAAVESPAPAGTFRATEQQLKSLTVEPVGVHGFVTEELTEGKIAVNGERTTPLFSPYSGRVVRVMASLGDVVKAGTPLAVVEASEFVQAQNDLATAVAQVKIARINETRKHALYDAKGGSLQDWQQAQADLTAAETVLHAVRNRLQIFGKTAAQIDVLEASQSITPGATLVAPIAGVIVDRQVGQGQYLQAGASTPVYTIADPTSVWLLANVREDDAGLVHIGQPVEVHVLAYPKRTFSARVSYVAALVDPVTHRLPVRAEIANADGALKPEMFANFRIVTGVAADAPAVPEAAIIYEGDLAHVWVLSDGGVLAYRAITTGRNNDGLVEVLTGLHAGEKIVVKGGIFIDQVATPASS